MPSNKLLQPNQQTQAQPWEFQFLSGLSNEPAERYSIRAEKNESTCKICNSMDGKIFSVNEAVAGKTYPPFHPNCRCTAHDENGKLLNLWEAKFRQSMLQSYRFTKDESNLVLRAYKLLYFEASRAGMTRRQMIHHIFSNLAALCDTYSGESPNWRATAGNPSTDDAKKHLTELGMRTEDVDALYEAIMRQHEVYGPEEDGKDFAHEMAEIAVFSNDSIPHEFLDGLIGDLNALAGYKGDVFSTIMPLDDMNSDVDAINIYNRMMSSNKGLLNILVEYNSGVKDGTINRVDEFLEYYGDGDAEKGLEYIKNDLLNVDMGAHYLAKGDETIFDFAWETIQDFMFKGAIAGGGIALQDEETLKHALKNNNADKVFEESEIRKKNALEDDKEKNKEAKSITEVMEAFIKYLEERMSK